MPYFSWDKLAQLLTDQAGLTTREATDVILAAGAHSLPWPTIYPEDLFRLGQRRWGNGLQLAAVALNFSQAGFFNLSRQTPPPIVLVEKIAIRNNNAAAISVLIRQVDGDNLGAGSVVVGPSACFDTRFGSQPAAITQTITNTTLPALAGVGAGELCRINPGDTFQIDFPYLLVPFDETLGRGLAFSPDTVNQSFHVFAYGREWEQRV